MNDQGELVGPARDGAHMSFIIYKTMVIPYTGWFKVAKKMRYGKSRHRPFKSRTQNRHVLGILSIIPGLGWQYGDYETFAASVTAEQTTALKTAYNKLANVASWTDMWKIIKFSSDEHKQERAIANSNYFMAWADNLYVTTAKVVQSDHQKDKDRRRRDVKVDIRYDQIINSLV